MEGYRWFFKRKKKYNPKDSIEYWVTQEVIDYTIKILKEYGARKYPAEGLVYWAGESGENVFKVTAAIAPETNSSRHGIETSHEANAKFVGFICDEGLEYIAQVHSHPGSWVDHSDVDNKETAFRSEGLVSVVVPSFGQNGMTPMTNCGIHRYTKGKFIRLSNKYIQKHFKVITDPDYPSLLKDLRYE